MEKIAYQLPDGTTCIVTPVEKSELEKILGVLTDEQYESHVMEKSIPANAIGVTKINSSDIPVTKEFRNAWVLSGTSIFEDLSKSTNIKLAQIRAERDERLAVSDKSYMKALESGDQEALAKLKVVRQSLRDATNSLKNGSIKSVDELRGKKVDDYLPKG